MLVAVNLHRPLRVRHFLFQVAQLLHQPVGGLARGVELGLQLVDYVGLGNLVGHPGCHFGAQGPEADDDDVGELYAPDVQLSQEDIDGPGHDPAFLFRG